MELTTTDIKVTSMQLAEMANKKHDYILKAIRKMDSVTISSVGTFDETSYLDTQNKTQPMYVLDKWTTLFVASKFNDELRANIINRVKELENTIDIPQEMIEQFVPNGGFMEENKKGMLRTKPVSGYWRVDKDTEENRLLHRRYELNKQLTGLFIEDIKAEIAIIDDDIKALEG